MKDFWVTVALVTFIAAIDLIFLFAAIHVYMALPVFQILVGK